MAAGAIMEAYKIRNLFRGTLTPNLLLRGQTAVVTGAAGLLGREHSHALAEAGADLILVDTDTTAINEFREELLAEFPERQLLASDQSVSDKEGVSRLLSETLTNGLEPRILVNNAALDAKVPHQGAGSTPNSLEEFSIDQWNHEIAVGLTGALICCQVFGGWMAKHGGGVIVNIASDLSVIAPDQRLYVDACDNGKSSRSMYKPVSYPVVKTGLLGLTRYLATYWAQQGIRVNALSPGSVQADQDEGFIERLQERIPMARMASRSEYRGAIVFLCSQLSSYMTGQNLVIDGGRSIW